MENTQEINKKIANNLMRYRKAAGLTQAELAAKINYSDKSVSKWESGNGIPDVYTLLQIAELYGVTVDAFLGDEQPVLKQKPKNLYWLIMLLSSGIIWLVATCIFVIIQLVAPWLQAWMAFIYAIVANAILLIVLSGVWRYRLLNFMSVSLLIWSALCALYLTVRFVFENAGTEFGGLWLIFIIGIPLQGLEILWVFFRFLFTRDKEKRRLLRRQKENSYEAEIATTESESAE